MNIAEYVMIFENLAKAHKNLRSFFYMNESRLKSFQPQEITYPCLMLENPTIYYDNETIEYRKVFKGSFAILAYTEIDNEEYQDFTHAECERIAQDFILKLPTIDGFIFDASTVVCEAVKGFTHDNLYGWRVMFDIQVDTKYCELDVWNDDLIDNDFAPHFEFINASENKFDVVLGVITPDIEAVTWEVEINNKKVPVTNNSFVFTKTLQNNYAYVVATITKNGLTKKCYAYIRNRPYIGESIEKYL